MTRDQRETVFGRYVEAAPPAAVEVVEGATLLEEGKRFQEESLAGAYYAPFAINSKNYRHIPRTTGTFQTRPERGSAGSAICWRPVAGSRHRASIGTPPPVSGFCTV